MQKQKQMYEIPKRMLIGAKGMITSETMVWQQSLNVSGSHVKNKCGVFCLDSNNLLAITYKTVKNIWDEWKEEELK